MYRHVTFEPVRAPVWGVERRQDAPAPAPFEQLGLPPSAPAPVERLFPSPPPPTHVGTEANPNACRYCGGCRMNWQEPCPGDSLCPGRPARPDPASLEESRAVARAAREPSVAAPIEQPVGALPELAAVAAAVLMVAAALAIVVYRLRDGDVVEQFVVALGFTSAYLLGLFHARRREGA